MLKQELPAFDVPAGFNEWLKYISAELKKTTAHIEVLEGRVYKSWAEENYKARQAAIAKIQDEIAMEQLHASALELLIQ